MVCCHEPLLKLGVWWAKKVSEQCHTASAGYSKRRLREMFPTMTGGLEQARACLYVCVYFEGG